VSVIERTVDENGQQEYEQAGDHLPPGRPAVSGRTGFHEKRSFQAV
jgi:hypothetical protein